MTILDAHAHLWKRDRTPQPWIDPASMAGINRDFWIDDLADVQRQTGVTGSILVQSSNSSQETVDLLELAGTGPVIGVIGWIDLEGDVLADVSALHTQHLVGIRHLAHQDPDPHWLARPGLDFAALAALHLPFDLVVRPDQLQTAAQTVAANPRTSFVLDHLGNPPISSGDLDQWRRGLSQLAALENVVTKLSGITLQANWANWSINDLREPVETALELFGASRMMFGSDWPLVGIASTAPSWIDIVRELVPAEHHDAVFSENARRVYLGGTHA
jgi:L-fuconolactonase